MSGQTIDNKQIFWQNNHSYSDQMWKFSGLNFRCLNISWISLCKYIVFVSSSLNWWGLSKASEFSYHIPGRIRIGSLFAILPHWGKFQVCGPSSQAFGTFSCTSQFFSVASWWLLVCLLQRWKWCHHRHCWRQWLSLGRCSWLVVVIVVFVDVFKNELWEVSTSVLHGFMGVLGDRGGFTQQFLYFI